jgi:hypothetical protein
MATAMEVADELRRRAEQLQRSYGSPLLAMRVESERGAEELASRVLTAISTMDTGDDVYWSVDSEPEAVVVRQWGYSPDPAATLAALSQALAGAGIEGRLLSHACEEPARRTPPLGERDEELLECHVRLRGERRAYVNPMDVAHAERLGRTPPEPVVRFFADASALLAGIRAALAWVADPPPGVVLRSWNDRPNRDAGEVEARIAAWANELWGDQWRFLARAWWESDDAFRIMHVQPASGDVSFALGGADLAAGDWEPAYGALLAELRGGAAWGSYGFIKRGRRPAAVGSSLTYDWVPALHYGGYNLHHYHYEDVLAPDAFGAQLLGPGYSGRIPSGPDWERLDLEGDNVLLLHRDPAAWFGEPLPPITQEQSYRRDPSYPTPEVILRGREDFADVLISADVVKRAPFDPLSE